MNKTQQSSEFCDIPNNIALECSSGNLLHVIHINSRILNSEQLII